jgi:hypothetical protein
MVKQSRLRFGIQLGKSGTEPSPLPTTAEQLEHSSCTTSQKQVWSHLNPLGCMQRHASPIEHEAWAVLVTWDVS